MASAGEMTPPTGGRSPSWARAAGVSKITMTKTAMAMSVLMRPDRDMSGNLSCFLSITLASPEERGESVRATPMSAATRESAGRKTKHRRSRDAAGIRGVRQAARKRHETSLFERSLSEAGGGVRPFIPIQARKAKKETDKKKERRKAERRQTRSPRSALRRGAR